MKRRWFQFVTGLCVLFGAVSFASGHCEIPCGIYDDDMRIKMMAEHITTLEKSMKEILALSKDQAMNYNQIVRWVMNKETHATEFQGIVTQYFLTQRIKPDTPKYTEKLVLLHKMLITAMKCKQEVDTNLIGTLRQLLDQFKELYFSPASK